MSRACFVSGPSLRVKIVSGHVAGSQHQQKTVAAKRDFPLQRGFLDTISEAMPTDVASQNVAFCLVEGGDDRLTIQPELGMNKYNVPNVPTHGISRSSSTSSGPTLKAFSIGQSVLGRFAAPGGPEAVAAEVRQRILKIWDLDKTQTCVTLFPSGTDAEFLFGLLALGRAAALSDGRHPEVLSVVTCKGEVGSGTALAAACCHFSALLPSGRSAKSGSSIMPPLAPAMRVQEVMLREPTGQLREMADVDSQVESLVTSELEKKGGSVGCCVVHLVLGCKTGHCSPSIDAVDRLSKRFGQRVLIVVDACQGRLQDGAIRNFIDRDYGVLVTGSKFYAGPPFCGAALLGKALAGELEGYLSHNGVCSNVVRESELREYLCSPLSDPLLLPSLGTLLPNVADCSPGLFRGPLLRWSMALTHAEAYHALPGSARDALIASWATTVEAIATQLGGQAVQPVREQLSAYALSTGILATNTIISLQCQVLSGDVWRRPSLDELRLAHRLMALDLSHRCKRLETMNAETISLMSQRCFIAQPVSLGADCAPVLRVALGAPQVVDAYEEFVRSKGQGPYSWPFYEEEKTTLLKLAHILGNWDALSTAKEAVLTPTEKVKYIFRCWDRFLQGSMHNGDMLKLLRALGLAWSSEQFEAFLGAIVADAGGNQVKYETFIDCLLQGD